MSSASKCYSELDLVTLSSRTFLVDFVYFRGSGHFSSGEKHRDYLVHIICFPGEKSWGPGELSDLLRTLPQKLLPWMSHAPAPGWQGLSLVKQIEARSHQYELLCSAKPFPICHCPPSLEECSVSQLRSRSLPSLWLAWDYTAGSSSPQTFE